MIVQLLLSGASGLKQISFNPMVVFCPFSSNGALRLAISSCISKTWKLELRTSGLGLMSRGCYPRQGKNRTEFKNWPADYTAATIHAQINININYFNKTVIIYTSIYRGRFNWVLYTISQDLKNSQHAHLSPIWNSTTLSNCYTIKMDLILEVPKGCKRVPNAVESRYIELAREMKICST